jgi:chemotaxis protein CheD
MLPSHKFSSKAEKKYADSAIPLLLKEMADRGVDKNKIIAKIIGGSRMFNVGNKSLIGEIGNNNVDKVKEILRDLRINIVAEDTGGNFGRTIDFILNNGEVRIRSIGRPEKII